MKTYEFYKENGQEWIENNIAGLCGNCEMIRSYEHDNDSDAYICDEYILHVNHSSADTIESVDLDGNIIESWILD